MRTLLTNSGTGKIYASALAMRELGFKRVLFLVHRVTLAKQAKKSFEKVFDKKVTDEEFNQLTNDERMAMDEADATEEMQPLDYIFSRDILITRIQVISYHYLFVNLKGLVHIQHHILF